MKKIILVLNIKDKHKLYNSPELNQIEGILENIGYNVIYYAYENWNIDEFFELVKKNKPDFVFIYAYNKIHTELIKLKPYTKIVVLQSNDERNYYSFGKYWIPFVDNIITFNGDLNLYILDGLKPEQFNTIKKSINPNTMNINIKHQNTVYHEWNVILPGIDPDYKQIDVIKLLKEKHGEYYA